MNNISSFCVAALFLALVLGCDAAKNITGPTAKPYVSQADSFSITFPAGSKETAVGDASSANGDNKVTLYSTTNEGVGYRVKVVLRGGYSDDFIREMTVKDIMDTVSEITFPWQDDGTTDIKGTPTDAPQKEITFKGYPAIEASGISNELSGVGVMFKRQTLVWVAPLKKAYVLEVFSKKKEDLTSKAVNEFFDSFKIEQPSK
jgi:hypothetical protein